MGDSKYFSDMLPSISRLEQYFIQLCRALAEEGRFKVTVLCSLLRFI